MWQQTSSPPLDSTFGESSTTCYSPSPDVNMFFENACMDTDWNSSSVPTPSELEESGWGHTRVDTSLLESQRMTAPQTVPLHDSTVE